MEKQNSLVAGILVAGTAVACTKGDVQTPENNPVIACGKPNVVFILADDMGYGDISGLNRESKISTPGIDGLCSTGLVFTDAHSSSSMSTPSRYSVLTGRYPWRTSLKQGVLGSEAPAMIREGRRTLGNLFQEKGYSTACLGKWHLGLGWKFIGNEIDFTSPISDGPNERGFDYFYGIAASLDMPPYVYIENDKVTSVPTKVLPERTGLERMRSGVASEDFVPEEVFQNIADRAIGYIEDRKDSDAPYFLYLPLTAPHTPVLPSEEFRGRSPIGAYGDFVMMIDDMVQDIVNTLKSTGQYNNTIVVFAADNGCAHYVGTKDMEKLGHYPSYVYRGYKSDIYEGGHRIPLIVSWPGVTSGRRCASPVCLSDFYATFAEMLDIPLGADEGEDSFSFYGILSGDTKGVREDLIVTSNDGSFALTREGMKVIFTATSGGWSKPASGSDVSGLPEMQIYDLTRDQKEASNLYGTGDYYDNVSGLFKRIMRDYVDNGRSTPGVPVGNDTGNDWKQTELFRD